MVKLFRATLARALMRHGCCWPLVRAKAEFHRSRRATKKLAGNRGSNSPQAIKARLEASEKALESGLPETRQAIAELVEKSAGFDGNSSSKLRLMAIGRPEGADPP